jgi:RNase P subunit RPR2
MRKFVKEYILEKVIKEVVQEKRHIRSLEELRNAVLEKIRKEDPEVGVSLKRIKRITEKLSNISIRVSVKRSEGEEIDVCPICKRKLTKMYISSLTGEKIFVGMKCEKCGFMARSKSFKPSRYEFYWRERN